MVAVATTAIMPAFARSFAAPGEERITLVSFSVKYVCLILSGAAVAISIFADVVVRVLYGPKFAQSALLLQILIWTQVLVATDTVLKQAMIAGGREYAVAARSLAGLACLATFVIGLGYLFGLVGAAAGVLATAAITLSLDAFFVARQVLPLDLGRFLLRPLACALLTGGVLLALNGAHPLARLAAGIGAYAFAAALLRLVPRAEQAFLKDALLHGLGKSAAG
jgi:O-antigen/teichoic acid export membrane protein